MLLSNNTVRCRIPHITQYLNDQLIEKVKEKKLGSQMDEATDSNRDANYFGMTVS